MTNLQGIKDRFPYSPTSTLFSKNIIDFDQASASGWIRLSFVATEAFKNPAGFIQGGILTALLDDTMGPALWLVTKGEAFPSTVDLNVSFLAAARPGPLYGEGRVVQMGKTIAFLEGHLTDARNKMIARSISTARVVRKDLPKREFTSEMTTTEPVGTNLPDVSETTV